ncbi:MAG: DUF4234 domain-containing protein [Kofleriaceae bacterium]
MTRRSIAAVIILTCITFGIYGLVWFVKTKNEMVNQGADIPTAWLMIVPIASIYWMWKWSGGVEKVTDGKQGQAINFLLVFLTGIIGMAIIQSYLNSAVDAKQLPMARIA